MKDKIDHIINLSLKIISDKGINLKELYPEDLLSHCLGVAHLAIALGIEYNFNLQDLLDLGVGSLVHDYGKIEIADKILNKSGALDNSEYQLIQSHTSIGYRELKQYSFNKEVLDIVLYHHERLSGLGYPNSITDIPILVQIVSVADVYNALISERCYKRGSSSAEAFSILKEDKGLNQVTISILEDLVATKTI